MNRRKGDQSCSNVSCDIRAEKNIKGIRVGNEECKISQYADDSTLISDGGRQSLQNIFSVLDTFASVSGLKVNYEKTEAMWIGALKDSTNTMFPEKKASGLLIK